LETFWRFFTQIIAFRKKNITLVFQEKRHFSPKKSKMAENRKKSKIVENRDRNIDPGSIVIKAPQGAKNWFL
jgi:hypothetical protein